MIKECSRCKEPTIFEVENGWICDECKKRLINDFKEKYKNGAWLSCNADIRRITSEEVELEVEFNELEKIFDKQTLEIDEYQLQELAEELVRIEYGPDPDVEVEDVDDITLEPKKQGS